MAMANTNDQDVPVFLDKIDNQMGAVRIDPDWRGNFQTISGQFGIVCNEQEDPLQSNMLFFRLLQAELAGALANDGDEIFGCLAC